MLKVVNRVCIKCGEEKCIIHFPRYTNRKGNIAYTNCCKVCTNLYKKKHYQENKQPYLDRSKAQRQRDPEGYKKYLRVYYSENKEELLKKAKEYIEANRHVQNKRNRTYRESEQGRIKNKIRRATLRAIAKGDLVRPDTCEYCGDTTFVEAHHLDYSSHLNVKWYCKSCHEFIHSLNEGVVSSE